MRLLCLLLGVAAMPSLVAAQTEPRVTFSSTLEGASSNAGSPIVFSPDGKLLAFVSSRPNQSGYSVAVWNLAKRKAVITFDGAAPAFGSPVFSPDGKILAAAVDGKTMAVKLWEMETRKERASLKGGTGPLAYSPDGLTLASGGGDVDAGTAGLKLWEVATKKEKAFLPAEREARVGLFIYCVAFSADGKYVATGTGGTAKDGQRLGGVLEVWDAHTGKAKASLLDGIFPTAAAFSPNGKQLATSELWGNVLIWDLETNKRVATLQQYDPETTKEPNPTYSLAFSPDGKALAAATMRGIKLWVLEGNTKSARVDGPEATVWSVAWSADGKTLATAGSEKGDSRPDFETKSTVRLWQYHPANKTDR
jgi:WD40 repeat protein